MLLDPVGSSPLLQASCPLSAHAARAKMAVEMYAGNISLWREERRVQTFRHRKRGEALWISSSVKAEAKINSLQYFNAAPGPITLHHRGSWRPLFRSIAKNDCFWTTLISDHTKRGQYSEALKVYKEMLEEDVKPTTYTFVHALKACTKLEDLETGKKIHGHVIESGNESQMFVATMLMDMYVKCGSMGQARSVFDKLSSHDTISSTAMILGYAKKEMGGMALQLYVQVLEEDVAPDERTFVGVLKACSSLAAVEMGVQVNGKFAKMGCLEKGRSIHSQVVKIGFGSNAFVGNTLIDMYAKCGSMVDARHVFDNLALRDVVSWNAMILGYVQNGDSESALKLYPQMQQEGIATNERTFVIVLKACSSLAALEGGTEVSGKFVKIRCLEKGRSIHSQIVNNGFESNPFVANTLIDMYAKCGSMVDARHVFDRLPQRVVLSWSVLILGYAEQAESEEAFKLYVQMQEQGMSASSATFVSILKACGNSAALDIGKEIHAHICRVGLLLTTDTILANALIDMYGKCGSMVNAQQVFDALLSRDLVTWNALIAGYARQGEGELVFHLFERMKQDGIQASGVTFLSVLTVCSHSGLVVKGQEYFDAMSKTYGLTPTIEHFSCMVDLLGRADQLDKAVAMVEKMPFQPDLVMWRTLLGACQKWCNVNVGKYAFEHALKLDKHNAATYFLMSNIYADAGMWEQRHKVQARRENARAWKRKKPGQSWWTEIDGTVHTFVVGDTKHPQSQDIRAKVKDLSVKLKDEGYLHDVNNVSKHLQSSQVCLIKGWEE